MFITCASRTHAKSIIAETKASLGSLKVRIEDQNSFIVYFELMKLFILMMSIYKNTDFTLLTCGIPV